MTDNKTDLKITEKCLNCYISTLWNDILQFMDQTLSIMIINL